MTSHKNSVAAGKDNMKKARSLVGCELFRAPYSLVPANSRLHILTSSGRTLSTMIFPHSAVEDDDGALNCVWFLDAISADWYNDSNITFIKHPYFRKISL